MRNLTSADSYKNSKNGQDIILISNLNTKQQVKQ